MSNGNSENNAALRQLFSQDMLDVLVKVGLIALMAVVCFRIFAPFMNLLLWGLILGVALYPLQQRLAGGPEGKQGRAATLLVLGTILLLGAPTIMLASSFATHIYDVVGAFRDNQVTVPVPAESVAEWPIIGERLYAGWSAAAADLPAYLETLQPQLGELSSVVLSSAAGAMGNVLFFIGALIVGGIMSGFIGGVAVATYSSSFIPAGWLGLALSYSIEVTNYLKHGVKMIATLEAQMNAKVQEWTTAIVQGCQELEDKIEGM